MTFLEKVNQAESFLAEHIRANWPEIAFGCSFGKDSMVALDLIQKVRPDCPVFTVLSDTEFMETYEFSRSIAVSWKLVYQEVWFNQDKEALLADRGMCCGPPKVEATRRAVKDLRAWVSAIRRTEGITRVNFQPLERLGLLKINPILDFTELDVWRYTALHRLPVHPLYLKGYRSLGCRLCSVSERDEREPERAGRWPGTSKEGGECGIHTQSLR